MCLHQFYFDENAMATYSNELTYSKTIFLSIIHWKIDEHVHS